MKLIYTISESFINLVGILLALVVGLPLFILLSIVITVFTLPIYGTIRLTESTLETWCGKKFETLLSKSLYNKVYNLYVISMVPLAFFMNLSTILDS